MSCKNHITCLHNINEKSEALTMSPQGIIPLMWDGILASFTFPPVLYLYIDKESTIL